VSVDPNDGAAVPRLQVVGGGRLRVEELAAVIVALTPTVVVGDDDAPSGPPRRRVPAWTAAALREGVGGSPIHQPADLREPAPHG
jgi:hypothetical protein